MSGCAKRKKDKDSKCLDTVQNVPVIHCFFCKNIRDLRSLAVLKPKLVKTVALAGEMVQPPLMLMLAKASAMTTRRARILSLGEIGERKTRGRKSSSNFRL